MDYQWYPGHMTKTRREMQENLKLIDLLIEIVDARIPYSGRNPDLLKLTNGKACLLLLGKADLADPAETALWTAAYAAEGLHPYVCDLRKTNEIRRLTDVILDICRDKIERDRRRGITGRPIRAMVAGIPNVGKSTFINSFSGSSSLKTGNKPGVTRGRQWIRMSKEVWLLDTPGLLWPKFEDQETGMKIALTGSIPDDVLDPGELSADLIRLLKKMYPGAVAARYQIDEDLPLPDLYDAVALKCGCLKKGGLTDYDKTARILLDDFRQGRLGRITLDHFQE